MTLTMEISVNVISLSLVLILTHTCMCQECPYGGYWDSDYRACRPCSLCPVDVIQKESQSIVPMGQCEVHTSLCPKWCSVEVSSLAGPNDGRASAACPPTTSLPPVPFVNMTIDLPEYNVTAKSYMPSCIVYFSNMDTPSLQWTNPSGQPITTNDRSGKLKVTQDDMNQGVMSTLIVNGFQKEDEGNYMCSAYGEKSANETVLLEFVEPPPTTPAPNTPQEQSTPESTKTMKTDTSKMKEGGGLRTWTLVLIVLCVLGVTGFCAGLAFWLKKQRNRSIPRGRIADCESHPLTRLSCIDGLTLQTSDFVNANIVGLQACVNQLNCKAVIIRKNKRKIGQVRSGQDEFYIQNIAWDDSIEVCTKFQWGKTKCIKTLKMNCLKIGNTTETSAVIACPSVENTFYIQFDLRDASIRGNSQVEVMQGGCKELCNLRPNVAYSVQLGIKGQTGDTGAYNWVWKDEFSTKCISFQPVTPSDTSVKLTLTSQTVPQSLQLFCAINGSKPKQMRNPEIQFSSLVPGMDQVLHVQEKVGDTDDYRDLKEISFKTTGSVKSGGEYRDYATTDAPFSDCDQDDGSSRDQKKLKKRKAMTCMTGLLEAIHNFRDDREKYENVYAYAEQNVVKAVMDCLIDFLKDHKNIVPRLLPDVRDRRRMKGMDIIEDFMIEIDAVNYTGIFDILRRFIEKEEMHNQAGVCFAEQLLHAHSTHDRTCDVCKHAVFLLKRSEQKKRFQNVIC